MLYFAVALSWAQLRAMPVLQQHCGILAVLCPTCFSSLMYYIGKAAKTGHFPESSFPQWSGKQVSLCSFCGPCMDLVLLSTSSPVPSFPGQQTTNLALAMETLEVQATTSLSPGGGDLICPCRKWERASAVWNKKALSTIMSQSSHGKDTLTNHTQRSCNSTCIGQFPQWNWAWQWGKKKRRKSAPWWALTESAEALGWVCLVWGAPRASWPGGQRGEPWLLQAPAAGPWGPVTMAIGPWTPNSCPGCLQEGSPPVPARVVYHGWAPGAAPEARLGAFP